MSFHPFQSVEELNCIPVRSADEHGGGNMLFAVISQSQTEVEIRSWFGLEEILMISVCLEVLPSYQQERVYV